MVDNRPPQQPLHMNSPSEEPLAPTTIPWTEFSSSPLQTTGLKRKHSSTSDQGSEPTRSGRRWLYGLKARLLDPSQGDSDPAPTDSGYVTGQGTPDTQRTVNRDTSTAGTSPVLGRDGWRIFHKSVSADKVARFREIVPELEKLLTAHLRERGGTLLFTKTPRLKPRAIRLLVLGACEEGAEETIVVFCSEQEMSRIQSFFDTDRIAKELCQPHDNALPCFRVLASGHPFRLTAGNGSGIEIETLADPDIFNGSRTICGQPILFRKIDQSVAANAHSCPVRKGTLGGIIQVILYDGTSGYYGMTAGHAVLDWLHDTGQHGCDEKRLSVELARLPTFGEPLLGEGFEPRPLTPEPDQERDETDDMAIESPWKFASSEAIGGVMGDSVGPLQLNAGSMLWACDLALVRLDDRSLFPNQLIVRDKKSLASSQSVIRKHDLCTVFYGFPDTWQDVVIMSASRGLVYGILSEIPARVSLGFDDAFLEVYVVTLNNDNAISEGDSGAWVVDTLTWEVYGHVIGTQDLLGDVYVVPMSKSLSNVELCFGAAEAKLPSPLDFASIRLQRESKTEHVIARRARTPPSSHGPGVLADKFADSGYSSKHSTPHKREIPSNSFKSHLLESWEVTRSEYYRRVGPRES